MRNTSEGPHRHHLKASARLLCVAILLFFVQPHGAFAATSLGLQFDGTNDHVTFGPAPGLSLSNFTLEVWFKRTGPGISTSTGGGGIADALPLIDKGRGEGDGANVDMNYILAIRASDNRLGADFEEGATGASPGLNHPVAGITAITRDIWYHAAATYDGSRWRLYLNGVLETNLFVGQPVRSDSIQHAALATAMNSTGTPAGFFQGLLDEARIWNHVRSATEISNNFRKQIVSATGLVGRWGLNEGSGNIATNSAGGVNGTLVNGPVWVTGYPFEIAPTVSITHPPAGTNFTAPVDVLVEVAAFDEDGSVTNVAVLANGVSLGSAVSAPFALIWSNAPVGLHSLRAVATDDSGLAATSAPVSIIVQDPVVRLIAPTNGASFITPVDVGLMASVTPTNDPVTLLEFFAGTNKLGDIMAAPWSFTWSNPPPGLFTLVVVATESGGIVHTSAPVNVNVATNTITTNALPAVSITGPADGSSFPSGANVTLSASATDDVAVSKVEFFLEDEKFRTDTNAPYSVVWSNVALGLWTVTAVATDNEGLATTSAPVYVAITNSLSGTNTLVSQGASWRYLDDGSNQGTAWRAPDFDDSAWAVGAAQLGYGDGDEITIVNFGVNPNTRYITTYFRKAFQVPNPSQFAQLTVRLLRDDGAVVYLNGAEILRSNMPGGVITNGTLAATGVGGSAESTFFTMLVDATNVVAGANVLAVEVHQAAPDSSDISFDLQLLGTATTSGRALTRGPYLQSATTNSIIVRWRTDLASDSVVRFGTNAANLDQAMSSSVPTTEHIVGLTNLIGDTRYFYSIGWDTNTLASGTNQFFVTPPAVGVPRPTRLWVIGDSGTANANARAVRDAYLAFALTNAPADLWLMLGDNAYNSGLDTEYQAAVFDTYQTLLRNTVLWPTIGNHETDQQTSISTFPYLDIFTLPQNSEAGGVASGTERYYSFDYANIHFVCLDAMTSSRATNGAMATWLRDDLAATTQDWLIAFWHHPPYTKGSHDSDTESQLIQMRQNIVPILESYGVDLVLCGHSHCYERSYLLHGHYAGSSTLTTAMKLDDGDGRETGGGAYLKTPSGLGANYIVAGNGGQISGGPLNHPAMFISLNELGSLVIDISTNRLEVQMLGTATVRDRYTVIKQGAPAPVFERFAQQGFKSRRAEFLTNGYAALEDVTSPSAAGGTVGVSGDWVFYSAATGSTNSDHFGFSATDIYGGDVPATAAVNIAVDNAATQNVIVDDLGNGSFRLRCSGVPGRTYSIQFCNDLDSPAWQPLATATADTQGVFEHIDIAPAGPRFYRTTYP